MKFQRYKRGSLIMVDFTPSKGSELKGRHLAIVLTKKDSPTNSVLTVVPLSSKEKPYYLDLGKFLAQDVVPYLKKFNEQHEQKISVIKKELNEIGETPEIVQKIDDLSQNCVLFDRVLNTYINMNKNSYAMVQNITTVSKLRVLKPINKYDPILNIKISNENLNRIDSKIIELFTNQTC